MYVCSINPLCVTGEFFITLCMYVFMYPAVARAFPVLTVELYSLLCTPVCLCVRVRVDRCGCVANVNFAKTGMGLLEIAIVFGEAVLKCVCMSCVCMNVYAYVIIYTHSTHEHTFNPKLNLKA